jgi:Spy/CpxP family protein refolding chaperone
MKAELGLTEDQAAKIKTIQADLEKKVPWPPDRRTPPPSPEVLRQAEQDARLAILKVLTDEQKEKLLRLLGPGSGELRAPKRLP